MDVMKARVEDSKPPEDIVGSVNKYVERYSRDDRQPGMIVEELRTINPNINISKSELNSKGQPADDAAKEKIRALYKEELHKQVLICVLTTEMLLFRHKKNVKVTTDDAGFEKTVKRCGYVNPDNSLSDIFGAEDAVALVQDLPLRKLTPIYDVTAMICADSALEEGTSVDGGLGLVLEDADESMGLGLLTPEQRTASSHPVLMTPPQAGDGVYAVGPFG
jgi:hypothetical protein